MLTFTSMWCLGTPRSPLCRTPPNSVQYIEETLQFATVNSCTHSLTINISKFSYYAYYEHFRNKPNHVELYNKFDSKISDDVSGYKKN